MSMDSTTTVHAQVAQNENPRPRFSMTARQAELYDFVRVYIAKHGYGPSFEDIMAAMGLASKSGVHRMLKALEERGYVERLYGKVRAIRIVGERM